MALLESITSGSSWASCCSVSPLLYGGPPEKDRPGSPTSQLKFSLERHYDLQSSVSKTYALNHSKRILLNPDNPGADCFRREDVRLLTFRGFPLDAKAQPEELAKSGFIFTGVKNIVQCVFCNVRINNWAHDDCPDEKHRRRFRECPFIRGLQVGNVPLDRIERLRAVRLNRKLAYWTGPYPQQISPYHNLARHLICDTSLGPNKADRAAFSNS